MMDIDRSSLGWQPFLTPRQTRIICDALSWYCPATEDDSEAWCKLVYWFGHEAAIHQQKLEAS